jgi:hypothetical protein
MSSSADGWVIALISIARNYAMLAQAKSDSNEFG